MASEWLPISKGQYVWKLRVKRVAYGTNECKALSIENVLRAFVLWGIGVVSAISFGFEVLYNKNNNNRILKKTCFFNKYTVNNKWACVIICTVEIFHISLSNVISYLKRSLVCFY